MRTALCLSIASLLRAEPLLQASDVDSGWSVRTWCRIFCANLFYFVPVATEGLFYSYL